MQKDAIYALFERWNEALKSGDAAKVAALYADDAVLLPTMSNRIRHRPRDIEAYFAHFLQRRPVGRIDESHLRQFGELAVHSGSYTFAFQDGTLVPARFTFVYRWDGDAWMIVEHHSSMMPETSTS